MVTSLKQTMDQLAQLVISDPNIESAFLATLGNMEEVAAREIIKTITHETPPQALVEITQHAQDEHRHAFQLRALKPVKLYSDLKFYAMENELSEIGINFVLGFFGQQLLLKARSASRFAGYVHGALTIEQVPLQMYTAYYKLTKNEAIKKGLAVVLKDEADHLALGRKFYETLSVEERFDIDEINNIEAEMCELLGRRMIQVIEKNLNPSISETKSLENSLTKSRSRLTTWILALAENENKNARPQSAKVLEDSVLFITGQTKEAFKVDLTPDLTALSDFSPERLHQHMSALASETTLIGVSYALEQATRQLTSVNSNLAGVSV